MNRTEAKHWLLTGRLQDRKQCPVESDGAQEVHVVECSLSSYADHWTGPSLVTGKKWAQLWQSVISLSLLTKDLLTKPSSLSQDHEGSTSSQQGLWPGCVFKECSYYSCGLFPCEIPTGSRVSSSPKGKEARGWGMGEGSCLMGKELQLYKMKNVLKMFQNNVNIFNTT